MPSLQNVVLTDRAATPVNLTFVPRDIVANVGTVVNSTGVPLADKRLTISLNKTAQGNYKCRIQIAIPVVQDMTVNGLVTPTVTRTAYADMLFTFSSTSTEQERKDMVGIMQSALAPSNILINDTAVKLQGVY